jgi:transcriptional regulator with XRE-family HTH domain
MKDIGDLLKFKRMEKKYTLENVAKLVGVSINYISKLEKGQSTPSDEIIVRLSEILGIEEDFIFNSYGKTPLSIRNALDKFPTLANDIASLQRRTDVSDKVKEELIQTWHHWYKKLLVENNMVETKRME